MMKRLRFLIVLTGLFGSLMGQTTIYYDNFESGGLGSGNWTSYPGPNNGLAGVVNSTNSCGGTYHLRLGKTIDAGGANTAAVDVSINLSAYVDSQLILNFCTYHYYDETQVEDGVFASDNNGASFVKIISFTPSAWATNTWGAVVPYDLDELLTNAFGGVPATLVLRFQQRGTGNFNTSGDEDGIAIDNVRIGTEKQIVPASVPFYEDFEAGTYDPEWILSSRKAAGTTGPAGGLKRFPSIGFVNNNTWAVSGSHSLWMGKYADAEGANLNAADVHLTLGSYVDSQLFMSFFIADFYDETGIYDGIFASGDNGASFQKIVDYDPDTWYNYSNNPYFGRRVPYDLDKLLSTNLTCGCVPDTLILRFQQYGTGNFNTSGDEDGIFLDNLAIGVERQATYSSVPYFEGFESGSLDPEWIRSSREAAGTTGPANGLNRFPTLGFVNSNTWAVGGSHSLWMGKANDLEGNNLNAADLFLTLGTYVDSQLAMSFFITDFYDQTSIYDGIYASEDDGTSFHKIVDYDPDNWYNYSNNPYYGRRAPYDLDQLLIANLPCACVPDTLVLRFQQYGSGDFNTSGDEDGIFLDNLSISAERQPEYAQVPFFEGFESGTFDPEWIWSSRDAAGTTGPAGGLNRFPTIGFVNSNTWAVGGSHSLWMGKANDLEGNNLNAADLFLDLGSYADSQLTMSFFIADFYDETSIYDGIYASGDQGATFHKIIDYDPDNWYNYSTNPYYGRRVPYDLDKLLVNTLPCACVPDSLVLRFQQYGSGDFNTSGNEDGIFLDNLLIGVDPSPVYAPIPYLEDFESAVFDPEWKISSEKAIGITTLSSSLAQLNRFWRLQVYNLTNAVSGSYAMRMSKTADIEGANVNSLDLHVNLQGESQVELSYYIYKFYDEQQVDDGIWLSVDGGVNFVQIHNFDLANTANATWVQQTLDLSSLAASQSPPLVLSDSTIIRFQQYGTGDLSTSGDEDGYAFDDIAINCLGQVADFNFNVDCSTLQVDFTDMTQGTNITTPFGWDFDGDGIIDTVANGDISHIYAGTGTYDVTLYVGNIDGCGDSITQQIFIGSSVPAPTVNPIGPQINLCDGDTLLLSAQVGYQGYLWNTGETTPSIMITSPGSYSVRGLGIDGCYSTPTALEVTGRPTPLAPFISLVGEPEFCEGESVDLIAPFGATAYLWNTGDSTSTITVMTSGTYSVSIANSFGCFSPTADTTITVLSTPALPVISQSAGSTWLSSSSTGQTYTWFLDGVMIAADSQSIDANLFGTGNYTVMVSNADCESDVSDSYAFSIIGLHDLWEGSLTFFPNPTTGHFTIRGTDTEIKGIRISIYNALGQQVLPTIERQTAAQWSQSIDLSDHPVGIYQLQLEDGIAKAYRKILIQR